MKFGTPNAGDATAQREKWIEGAADERVQRLNDMDKILNRPLGSRVNLSDEERVTDWLTAINDPNASDPNTPGSIAMQFTQRAQAVGPDRAKLELLEWDNAMSEMATKLRSK